MDLFAQSMIQNGHVVLPNLLVQHLGQLKMTSSEFVLYVGLLSAQEQGIDFPGMPELAEQLGLTQGEIFALLQSLIEKHFIALNTTQVPGQPQQDHYDLTPVYDRLEQIITREQQNQVQAQKQAAQTDLFDQFQVEFSRMLSPLEIETIDDWLHKDGYSVELILLALKEAVLNQALSLKYIDRVLLSWEKKNIRTKADVQREKERRDQY